MISDQKILWLDIHDYRCRCGHTWTHSRVRHTNGGTPPPSMEEKNWCEGYTTYTQTTSHCHRCVPLQLGIGWTEPKWSYSSKHEQPGNKKASLDD